MNPEHIKLVIELNRISKMVMQANTVLKRTHHNQNPCIKCKDWTTHRSFCKKCREYQCDRCGETKTWAKVPVKRCATCKKKGRFQSEYRI